MEANSTSKKFTIPDNTTLLNATDPESTAPEFEFVVEFLYDTSSLGISFLSVDFTLVSMYP